MTALVQFACAGGFGPRSSRRRRSPYTSPAIPVMGKRMNETAIMFVDQRNTGNHNIETRSNINPLMKPPKNATGKVSKLAICNWSGFFSRKATRSAETNPIDAPRNCVAHRPAMSMVSPAPVVAHACRPISMKPTANMGTFNEQDAQRVTSAHHQMLSVFTISGSSLHRKAPPGSIFQTEPVPK